MNTIMASQSFLKKRMRILYTKRDAKIKWAIASCVVPWVQQLLGRDLPCVAKLSQIFLIFFTKV